MRDVYASLSFSRLVFSVPEKIGMPGTPVFLQTTNLGNSAFLTTENGGAVKRIIASPLPTATVNAAPSPTITLTSTPAESGINLVRGLSFLGIFRLPDVMKLSWNLSYS